MLATTAYGDDWDDWTRDWSFHLQHSDRTESLGTQKTYIQGLGQFLDWLHEHHPKVTEPGFVERSHVQGWMASLKDSGMASSTRRVRLMTVKSLFRWLRDEPGSGVGEILPTDRVEAPAATYVPKAIVYDDVLSALLATCTNGTFVDLRDAAILRLLISTGLRRAELVRIDMPGVDVNRGELYVVGKGNKPRLVSVSGTKATLALSRYLRARRKHAAAASTALFLAVRPRRNGEWRMTGGAIGLVLKRRCKLAGVPHIAPHQLRHTWAHIAKSAGLSVEDLERMAGWAKGSIMSRRYGEAVADERAREAHRSLNLGDRI
jgi:site-specific recombinase XerD